jgi:hypothetical protein
MESALLFEPFEGVYKVMGGFPAAEDALLSQERTAQCTVFFDCVSKSHLAFFFSKAAVYNADFVIAFSPAIPPTLVCFSTGDTQGAL